MVKREGGGTVDVDVPHPKRRKDSDPNLADAAKSEDVEMADAGASSDVEGTDEKKEDVSRTPDEVAELGLKVWHIVKLAQNREGFQLSPVFMRLPSKRQYADYYEVIKKPIALEEIKARLDARNYASLEEVRQDFELCFKNAKRYNQRESQIWKDAKHLQKMVNKEIDKIVRPEGDEDGSDEEGGKKKKGKGSNVHRLMKNRLQKLITTTDADGRAYSDVFMDLPSRKKWPMYYKIIKRPICFEDIFKRIKRKEYITVQDFMADVDLVFQNAVTFNEDSSPVHHSALQLKYHFRQIMKDVLTQPQPEQQTLNKIVLKVPNPYNVASGSQDQSVAGPSNSGADANSGQIHLRLPATNTITDNAIVDVDGSSEHAGLKGKSPALAHKTLHTASFTPVAASSQRSVHVSPKGTQAAAAATAGLNALAQAASKASTVTSQAASAQVFQSAQSQSTYVQSGAQFATTFYQTPGASKTTATAPAPSRTSSAISSFPAYIQTGAAIPPPLTGTASSSTAPSVLPRATPIPLPPGPQFRSVCLLTLPLGRRISLDHDEGVRSWMIRLGKTESKLIVSNVEFLRKDEDEEEEGEEEEGERSTANGTGLKTDDAVTKAEEEEEEEEEHPQESAASTSEPVTASPTITPPRRKRGRGRPPRTKANGIDKDKENKAKSAAVLAAAAAKNQNSRRAQGTTKSRAQMTMEDVLVKVNGIQLSSRPSASPDAGEDGKWDIEVESGNHVLEVAQKSLGSAWKVYIERRA